MRIQIVGCNNHRCKWFHEEHCTLMAGKYDMRTGKTIEVERKFDYDHITGKIACRNCLED